MSIDTIDAENTKPEPETGRPKGRPKATKEANPAKKATRAKNAAAKPKAERTNKKGDVIALRRDRPYETRKRRKVSGDHERDGLAGATRSAAS
jgi:hypothetical protein